LRAGSRFLLPYLNPIKHTYPSYGGVCRVQNLPIALFTSVTGTLVLHRRTAAAWKDMALLCTSHFRPEAVYSSYFGGSEKHRKPISFDPYVPYTDQPLEPQSPLYQRVKLEKSPHSRASLSATYRSNPKSTRAVWTKDGGRLPLGFPTPTPYVLTFPESIQSSFSGVYVLTVTDGSSQLEFRYDVDVVGPPEVIRSSPSLLLVMEGKSAELECEIDLYRTLVRLSSCPSRVPFLSSTLSRRVIGFQCM
uniref:Ig-like domain-containing protein n=1 Tax=Echinostoma caproni TaxID=27848 RepID=A0A183A096_9TREM